MSTLIQLRRGTADEWTASDPVLHAGEAGVEINTGPRVKIGDGVSAWESLPYIGDIVSVEWSKLTGTPTSLAGYGIVDPVVVTSGTYADPAWITSLAWGKLTGTPTTLAGYGIADPVAMNGIATGLVSFTHTRSEAAPAAPTAALVATAGNCTPGSHVFAVVFNTLAGHTAVSPVSNVVTVDGTHAQVDVTIPESVGGFVISRDVYASKAGTTAPLFLVSSSPVVNWPNANPDRALTNVYRFNIADANLTATQAPAANTTLDTIYKHNPDGTSVWGNEAALITTGVSHYFHTMGNVNCAIFHRHDQGEARICCVASGFGEYAFPTIYGINTQKTIVDGAVTAQSMPAGVIVGVFGVRGSRNSTGSLNQLTSSGLVFKSTEQWSDSAQGMSGILRLMGNGTNTAWDAVIADSVNGVQANGKTSDSTACALKALNAAGATMLAVRNDGRVAVGATAAASFATFVHVEPTGIIGDVVVKARNSADSTGRTFLQAQNDAGKNFSIVAHGSTYSADTFAGVSKANAVGMTGGTSPSSVQIGVSSNTGSIYFGFGTATVPAMSIVSSGTGSPTNNIGLQTLLPTAYLHIAAGTATAKTAPLKFTSGTLLTTAEAGAIEYLTDNYYATIATGAARKPFVFTDGAILTSGKIPIASTNGRLIDGPTPLAGTKVYYAADASGGAVTRKLTFTDGILTAET